MADEMIEIFERIQQGDEKAWAEAYTVLRRWIIKIGYRSSGNFHDAEEILQKTMITLYTHQGKFYGGGAIYGLIAEIARRHTYREFWKRIKREKHVIGDYGREIADMQPADVLLTEEEIRAAIETLPQKQKVIMEERICKGRVKAFGTAESKKNIDVAKELGFSRVTYYNQLASARKKLRAEFGKIVEPWEASWMKKH